MRGKRFLIRAWDRLWLKLFYRKWTPEQLKDRVALSVANANYRPWHEREPGPMPVTSYGHGFTELTEEEIADRKAKGTYWT